MAQAPTERDHRVRPNEFAAYLEALAQGGKSWKPKFFLIRDNFLMFFKTESDKKPEGVIPLEEAKIALAPAYERCFEVTTSSRRYHLRAPTEADTQIWLQKIQDAAALTIESLYDVLELLGQGTFAKVKRGRDKATGQEFAIKIIDKNDLSENRESILTEISILKNVSHPNIINLYDTERARCWTCDNRSCIDKGSHHIFESKKKIYLVTELLEGGELFDLIVERGHFSETDASKLIRKVVEALAYLHSKNIVHRDLKPENLLFSSSDNLDSVRVTDFGLSKIANQKLKTACGTPGYVAPEILEAGGYGFEVDMWSTGVILYVLLCGFPPFYADNDADLYDLIKTGEFSFPSPYWDDVSDSAKQLIRGLLVVEPKDRLTPEQVLAHPFITDHVRLSVVQRAGIARQLSKHHISKRTPKLESAGDSGDGKRAAAAASASDS